MLVLRLVLEFLYIDLRVSLLLVRLLVGRGNGLVVDICGVHSVVKRVLLLEGRVVVMLLA